MLLSRLRQLWIIFTEIKDGSQRGRLFFAFFSAPPISAVNDFSIASNPKSSPTLPSMGMQLEVLIILDNSNSRLNYYRKKFSMFYERHKFFVGNDEIIVSGSGMVQATILDAMNEIKFYHGSQFEGVRSPNSLPRLDLDVPHAVLSFSVS